MAQHVPAREPSGGATAPVSPSQVIAEMQRIFASQRFARSPVLRRLLQVLVERTLSGRIDQLKEYSLGVDVFDRGIAFDPTTDTIVRAEARRLRARLAEYYEGPGRGDPVVIGLPKGSYVVTFAAAQTACPMRDGPALHLAPSPSGATGSPRPFPLPSMRTPLVGRESDLASLRLALLSDDVRLVTLTGAGGSGKTRLAVAAGLEVEPELPGGVRFVPLESFTDERAAAREIAHAVGLRHSDFNEPGDALLDHLRLSIHEPTLLVLDNLEQLTGVAPLLARMLDVCPAMKLLVTSRALLRVAGEQNHTVPPLPVPTAADRESLEALSTNPAVMLFVQRATAIEPSFALTGANAPAIAEICVQLDGLPLALELAAARIRVLPPADLSARMKSRLEVLTNGPCDVPARQQTLRNTLEWSYALLTEEERRLLRRLTVFAGGWTMEAVEAVCNTRRDLGFSVLDGLTSLLDKSLIRPLEHAGAERRFGMLATVREFAGEQLDASGERALVARAHAAYCLVIAEEIALRRSPAELFEWLATCDAEHDNLREALAYVVRSGNADWALRLGVALYRYWEHREYPAEGSDWLRAMVSLPAGRARTAMRARALGYAAALVESQGDYAEGRAYKLEALDICLELGDRRGAIDLMNSLGAAEKFHCRYAEALKWSERTLKACQDADDNGAVAAATSNLGDVLFRLGRRAEGRQLMEQATAMFAALGDQTGVAWCRNHLGDFSEAMDECVEARRHYQAGLEIFRLMENRWGVARSACDLGHLACKMRDFRSARDCFREALTVFVELRHKRGVAAALAGFARLAIERGEATRALTLAGAATGVRRAAGAPGRRNDDDRRNERVRDLAAARCDPAESRELWMAGCRMSLEQAIHCALTD